MGTHPEQALVLINDGGTAAEVAKLADHLAGQVKARTGLDIEWEVERMPRAAPESSVSLNRPSRPSGGA